MRIEPLGDCGAILRDLGTSPYLVANYLRELPGIDEAIASYETVGVYFEPGNLESVEQLLRKVRFPLESSSDSGNRRLTIPVLYDGADLDACAAALGLSTGDIADLHCGRDYQCFAIGFTPGFPYLGYLDGRLSGLPRRASPRVRVEAGSIGITGRQTGIYPSEVPGGWNLIGRTPIQIVDLTLPYFAIEPGNHVRFRKIDREEFDRLEGARL